MLEEWEGGSACSRSCRARAASSTFTSTVSSCSRSRCRPLPAAGRRGAAAARALRGPLMQIGKAGDAVSHISQAYPDRVEVRGRDLTRRPDGPADASPSTSTCCSPASEPTEDQRYFLDLLLVAIAEHGMMPTNVAARMTLAADPGSLQGAVAAGILGCGPVILGTSEACARLLERGAGAGRRRRRPADGRRRDRRSAIHAAGGKAPGLRPPGPPPARPARRADPRARRRARRERAARRCSRAPPRRRRERLGPAADDERRRCRSRR